MPAAYVSLGSNQGDRLLYLRRSLELLEREPKLIITAVSPLYETVPVGGPPQGLFLNACACAETTMPPAALLAWLLEVETGSGRVRCERWGPRTVDLDLLLYDGVVMRTPSLELPHPRLTERAFVLVPLSRIAPGLVVPGTGKTVQELLRDLAPGPAVNLFKENWR